MTRSNNAYIPVIALDAGHGLYTAGKRVTLKGYPCTSEWWLNDRIIDIVETELRNNYECKVIRVDDTTGQKDISLSNRVAIANNAKADVYLSMHHDAGLNGRDGGGTTVYYYSNNIKRRDQAQKLYNYITDETKLYGNRCQQVIKNGFYVIKKTTMPAFLVENGFMDSPTDVPRILSVDHAKKTARGVLAFLVEQFCIEPKKSAEIDNNKVTEASQYYPAYTGSKTTLYNAMTSLKLDASYKHRKAIAKANGISLYVGTASQNTKMYNLLVAGLLKKE
jgi:N-acetylmuramoyl-L-alanine amidase